MDLATVLSLGPTVKKVTRNQDGQARESYDRDLVGRGQAPKNHQLSQQPRNRGHVFTRGVSHIGQEQYMGRLQYPKKRKRGTRLTSLGIDGRSSQQNKVRFTHVCQYEWNYDMNYTDRSIQKHMKTSQRRVKTNIYPKSFRGDQ